MSGEISITPGGHLVVAEAASGAPAMESWVKRIAYAFSTSRAAGLFALAATKLEGHVTPSVSYWREFSNQYLAELCRTPESSLNGHGVEAIEPPPASDLEMMLSRVPPMKGAEYLNVEMLLILWEDLDSWVRREISASGEGLSRWLKQHAPIWHQVGRVCFHLAENKRDAEYPFAFLATYAPKVSSGGRVQYQPLSRALQEHAGGRDKKALINLLSPVHLASQKSEFVKDLVSSNDIFHPLMWTPADAYRFLKEVPFLEESGVLVRLPDWWRKRPRPRVSVTIGDTKQSHLSLDTVLDFQVQLSLGDTKLSPAELQQLMSAEEGLVYLKGQWVEVDRERLSEALEHWKHVEKQLRRAFPSSRGCVCSPAPRQDSIT
jgi:non-specific serine/threonine protein kinase